MKRKSSVPSSQYVAENIVQKENPTIIQNISSVTILIFLRLFPNFWLPEIHFSLNGEDKKEHAKS